MQEGNDWILPNEMNATRFCWDSHWLEIWFNHLFHSMVPNGVTMAMDSEKRQAAYQCNTGAFMVLRSKSKRHVILMTSPERTCYVTIITNENRYVSCRDRTGDLTRVKGA